MIDVVYKLGSGSEYNNIELRYSLRSLSNFIPLRNVYVVGYKPDWIQNIIHISAEDCYTTNKDANLINKLLLATIDPNLSEEFVNMSDDQVFLKECTYEDLSIPLIDNKHYLENNRRLGKWQNRLMRTRDKLKSLNLPSDCFEAHVPYLLSKNNYASILFKYDYGFDKGYCGNTLYFNTLKKKGKEIDANSLARIVDPIVKKETIYEICDNKQFLNYTDKAINDNLLLYLQNKFSAKSKYEV